MSASVRVWRYDPFRQREKEQRLLDRELRTLREENSCLKQKICDLEGELGNARCQLDGRTALLEEMKGLLEQRAARIKHLEKNRDQLSLSMETDLLNGSTDSLVTPHPLYPPSPLPFTITHTPYLL